MTFILLFNVLILLVMLTVKHPETKHLAVPAIVLTTIYILYVIIYVQEKYSCCPKCVPPLVNPDLPGATSI